MAYTISVYHDFAMQQTHQVFVPGVAALHNGAESSVNWGNTKDFTFAGTQQRICIQYKNSFTQDQVTLSGGNMIYSNVISGMIPNQSNFGLAERTKNQNSTSSYINAFFCGKESPSSGYPAGRAFWIGINAGYNSETSYNYTVSANIYYQNTVDNPTAWDYDVLLSSYVRDDLVLNDMPQTKIYRCVIDGKDYYMFAFGVNGNTWDTSTWFVAFPCALFKDSAPVPYVGPSSEPDPDTGFFPSDEPSDVITPRTGFDTNPYNINQSGSGIKVIFPGYVEGGYTGLLGDILSGIYQGSNEGFINRVEQVWASVVGGNTNRSWEEIQAIMNGILLSHSVPAITDYTSAYFQSFKTICGYNVLNESKNVTKAAQSIFSVTKYSDIITPRLGCFLDYEPYTSMVLKLPFCPAVQISPSAVYGKSLKVSYKIDILTGILHCDVSIYSATDDYIIHTAEANVKTDIPIMGQGANSAGLEKITGAVLGFMNGDPGAGALMQIGEMVAGKSHGSAVGKMSMEGISAYLASRSGYLIVTYPKAAIPADSDGALTGGFLNQQGMAASVAGKVSSFEGGTGKLSFAKFSSVNLSSVDAPQEIKEDIERRLKEGVYL